MFPENLVQACFQGIQTEYEYKPIPAPTLPPGVNGTLVATTMATVSDAALDAGNATAVAAPLMKIKRVLKYRDGMNVLGRFAKCTSYRRLSTLSLVSCMVAYHIHTWRNL